MNKILVMYIDKQGNTINKWLTRREIMNLSIDTRRQILKDEAEKFAEQLGDYYKEELE